MNKSHWLIVVVLVFLSGCSTPNKDTLTKNEHRDEDETTVVSSTTDARIVGGKYLISESRYVRQALAIGRTIPIGDVKKRRESEITPAKSAELEENLRLVGRLFYRVSTRRNEGLPVEVARKEIYGVYIINTPAQKMILDHAIEAVYSNHLFEEFVPAIIMQDFFTPKNP